MFSNTPISQHLRVKWEVS